jgi:hypothetical protein
MDYDAFERFLGGAARGPWYVEPGAAPGWDNYPLE